MKSLEQAILTLSQLVELEAYKGRHGSDEHYVTKHAATIASAKEIVRIHKVAKLNQAADLLTGNCFNKCSAPDIVLPCSHFVGGNCVYQTFCNYKIDASKAKCESYE